MVRLVCAVLAALSLFVTAARAADDVSGVWSVAGQPDARLLIERQADRFRIAVTDADALGLGFDWYVGETRAADLSSQDISVEALLLRRLFGYPQTSARVLDRAGIRLALTDPFRGSLTIGGRSFDVERKELVRDGLIAALDAEAPETGWYGPDGGGAFEFFEAQGSQAFLVRLSAAGGAPATVRIEASKSGPATWTGANATIAAKTDGQGVVAFALNAGAAAVELKRARFAKRGGTFVADVGSPAEGADADGDGVRDDIGIAIGDGAYASSRLREGLSEIARAYRRYLAAPSSETAVEALTRTEAAKACLSELVPNLGEEPVTLIESLVFNTQERFAIEQRLPSLAGQILLPQSPVSLRNPNACASFMQGVIRRYDVISPSAVRRAQAAPRRGNEEKALAASRRRLAAAASPSTSCASTKIILVTGVITGRSGASDSVELLESLVKQTNIDAADYAFAPFPDTNPGLNDIVQFLVASIGASFQEATTLARTGLRFTSAGDQIIRTSTSRGGLIAGRLLLSSGQVAVVVGLFSAAAIVENAIDTAFLRRVFADNVADNTRVIAVAHSNGNLRSNRAYDGSTAAVKRSTAIASVANAARRVASGGIGATRDDDSIINFVRDNNLGAQRPTIFNAGKPRDFTGHFLDKSYLRNPTARREVFKVLKKALAKAQLPPGSSERVLAQLAGGFTGTDDTNETQYKIGKNGVTFRLNYEAFTIPDQFEVIYRGSRVAGTGGLVSGAGTLNVALPLDEDDPTDGDVIVAVFGPDPDTAWNYEIVCPAASNKVARSFEVKP